MNPIYLDNAATSWPKPKEVVAAMARFMEESGGNPGRAGHRLSIEAGRAVESARESICELFGSPDPLRVVFGANATWALNLALLGLLKPGDHVVTSSMEHNSVMRPLRALEGKGVRITVVECTKQGVLDPDDVERAVNRDTKLLVFTHASNVVGTILPIPDLGRIARDKGILLLVDAASTAGAIPINMEKDSIDLLAFTGHKSLLGPTGTGGLVIGDRVNVGEFEPLIRGGTGSNSETEIQPTMLPDVFESGTQNAAGLVGLKAGVDWILKRGVVSIRDHHRSLAKCLIEGLRNIDGVRVFGTGDPNMQNGTVSFTAGHISVSSLGSLLDTEHGILCRVGLHCAPSAHKTIGTFPTGTIRFAPGVFTIREDLDRVVDVVENLLDRKNGH